MAKKIRLTRPELKRQRDALTRFARFLPMLKLKQQQLQMTVHEVAQRRREAQGRAQATSERIAPYRRVLADTAGVNVEQLATPEEVLTHEENIAGVRIPVFESASFPQAEYSLFTTPPWVDRALAEWSADDPWEDGSESDFLELVEDQIEHFGSELGDEIGEGLSLADAEHRLL